MPATNLKAGWASAAAGILAPASLILVSKQAATNALYSCRSRQIEHARIGDATGKIYSWNPINSYVNRYERTTCLYNLKTYKLDIPCVSNPCNALKVVVETPVSRVGVLYFD